jgi:DMSO/TMAO reductase YedYZ molybdopterin-dependent catalytic subunit
VPWQGAAFGLLTLVTVTAVLALVAELTGGPFVPYVLFEWGTRVLPGAVVTFGIDVMVAAIRAGHVGPTAEIAKLAEALLSIALFVAIGPVVGFVLGALARRDHMRLARLGALAGAILFGVAAAVLASFADRHARAVSLVTWAIALPGWGALLGRTVRVTAMHAEDSTLGRSRRRFLKAISAGCVALAALAFGLERWLRSARAAPAAAGAATRESLVSGTSGPAASPSAAVLAARKAPAPGTRPEITATQNFYRIDINLAPPSIDAASWRLRVDGQVEKSLSLELSALRERPSISQVVTLQCISNPVGGDLTSTARFTGVRLKDILAEAGLRARARAVFVQAQDGFYETVSMADAMDDRTLLVYAMNEEPLTPEHGFPLRIYIPNRYGMKQPKWITRLEVTEEERPGYWVERGWSRDAIPNTTSVIDTVGTGMRVGEQTFLPVGGIAFAGARGISRVEVQVDAEPWAAATLIAPPLSPLTWVVWRYDWPYRVGRHVFRVRAYDGGGALQAVQEHGPRPNGATGIHEVTMTV